MPLSERSREYLRRLCRRDPGLTPWRQWCTENREELEDALTRPGYLRLKFSPAEALPILLIQERIPFALEELTDDLADAAMGLEWNAVPSDGYGVRYLYVDGRCAEGDRLLQRHAAALSASEDPSRGLLLGEMILDAEFLRRKGFHDEARGLAKAVAQLEKGDDVVDPAIAHALELLRIDEGT